MIKPLFGNIRNALVEKLRDACFDVYIAVAWITDKKYGEIILSLLERGISVTIIIVNDETNRLCEINWKHLVDEGARVYWDNHHHKFCVIDRKTVLTGSFNWTYMASNRMHRENLLVIEDEKELIEEFSKEFMKLKASAVPLEKEPKTIIQQVIVEKEIEKIVRKNITSLSKYKAYKTSGSNLLCGKCSSKLSSVAESDKSSVPPSARAVARWSCKHCGSYFSANHEYL